MRAMLMPERPGPSVREAMVTVIERWPGGLARMQFDNGQYRFFPTARLRTQPPGARRLTADELRAIPWNETRHGPDPLKQVGQLFDNEVRA